MKTATRKMVESFAVFVMVIGVGAMFYGLMARGEVDAQKTPPSIFQTNPYNSPPVTGDNNTVTINPEVNPNAPVVTYDFNGAKRTRTPNGIHVDVGAEYVAFQTIVKLMKAYDWAALRDLCEEEMRKTPQWLTPALCAGQAYANLGDMDKAIERLEYVQRRAGGNPDYKDAGLIREEIRQRTGK